MDPHGKSILVVDDEPDLCEILQYNLNREGYFTNVAHSAEDAMKRSLISFDLILLDIMMGPMSGLSFADKVHIELKLSIPIIFLTAKKAENDLITGFNHDADDYITKPFSINELLVRIRAVLNRYPEKDPRINNFINFGGIKLNIGLSRLLINEKYVELTKKECEILRLFVENPGKIFSREDILKLTWGKDAKIESRSVDVHISRLRNKLGKFGYYLHNKTGYGYYIET
jgi:two-component system, OmpR family, alkaline phosphatase synthesis response regulator PhoP